MIKKAKSLLNEAEGPSISPEAASSIWTDIQSLENIPQEDIPDSDVELVLDDNAAMDVIKSEFSTDEIGQPVDDSLGSALIENTRKQMVLISLKENHIDDVSKSGTSNYRDYLAWAKNNGVKRPIANENAYKYYLRKSKELGLSSDMGEGGDDYIEQEPEVFTPDSDEHGLMGSVANIVGDDYSGEIDTTRTTDDKYLDLREAVEDFISETPSAFEMGKGNNISSAESKNRHLYISGSPGVGKSYEILTALREGQVHPFWEDKVHFEKNIIGSTVAAKALLAKFSQNLLIFDDATRMLTSPVLSEFMKTLLDMENPRVGRPKDKGEKKLVLANMEDLYQDNPRAKKESAVANYLEHHYNPFRITEVFGDEDEDVYDTEDPYDKKESDELDAMGDGEDGEAIDPWTQNGGMLPFRSRVLFISNKPITVIDSAIRSRFKKADITLSADEILDKIGMLKNSLYMKGQTDPIIVSARDGALYFLKLAAKAKGKPIQIKAGVTLRLVAPGLLTFRTFKDICEAWVGIARSYGRKGIDWNKIEANPAIKAEFMNRFIKTFNQNMMVTGEE